MSEFIATFYIAFFILYLAGGLAAGIYAGYLYRTIRRIEDEAKERLIDHENSKRHNHDCNDNVSTHKSDPTQPLLGVVYPKGKGEWWKAF